MEQTLQKKTQILIADDSEINREIFIEMLGEGYEILEAENGVRAVELIRQHADEIALILLDIIMPELDGFGVLQYMNDQDLIGVIPVLVISSSSDHESICHAYELGATDYLMRNSDGVILRQRVSNSIQLFARQKAMLQEIRSRAEQMAEQMYHMECIDELTGCNNMREFERVAMRLMQARPEDRYALWYCDIKQLKLINEQFGYEIGDQVLQHWAQVLAADLEEGETFGRINADCFVVLTRYTEWQPLINRFTACAEDISTFLQKKGMAYSIEIAAGAYLVEQQDIASMSISRMIDRASLAQQSVKNQNGSRWAVYDGKLMEQQMRKAEISKHLPVALQNEEVTVFLQPQIDYMTGTISGAEALCRWTHQTLGWISPGEFIPILEGSGQVFELDRYVWEQVCTYLETHKGISLSVNLSRADIRDESLPELLYEMVCLHGVSPKRLHIEVTESAYMDDPHLLKRTVDRLREYGFPLEMDDFGSGFSSLNTLKELPVDVLKLDAQFLRENWNDARSVRIIKSVIRLAQSLNLEVIAEGVETKEQAEFLKNIGCRYMQGFYFAKPMPMAAFDEFRMTFGRK